MIEVGKVRGVLAAGLFGLCALGTVTPGPAGAAEVRIGVFAPMAPPDPRVEVVPVAPRGRLVWQPGHWRWDGHDYRWVSGHYVAVPRHRHHWVDGHWAHRPGGWVWIEGHWR
jgi:hypothetical protein